MPATGGLAVKEDGAEVEIAGGVDGNTGLDFEQQGGLLATVNMGLSCSTFADWPRALQKHKWRARR